MNWWPPTPRPSWPRSLKILRILTYHYETTAREIFEQMEGQIDALCRGLGNGGTFTGVARFVKERLTARAIRSLVETQGSVLGGGKPGPHKVEGIGASFIPKNFDRSVCDEVMMVTDDQAFGMVKQLAARRRRAGADRAAGAAVYRGLSIGSTAWERESAW